MKTKPKRTFDIKLFIMALLLPFAAGAIGSLFTSDAIPTWYATLSKPSFNPPNWVFGPVWTLLYALQGIAFYLVLRTKHHLRDAAIGIFVAQIILNTLWSILFFGLQMPGLALIDIFVLLGCIVWAIATFKEITPAAAKLLWPYLAWVSFAAVLNAAIVVLN